MPVVASKWPDRCDERFAGQMVGHAFDAFRADEAVIIEQQYVSIANSSDSLVDGLRKTAIRRVTNNQEFQPLVLGTRRKLYKSRRVRRTVVYIADRQRNAGKATEMRQAARREILTSTSGNDHCNRIVAGHGCITASD